MQRLWLVVGVASLLTAASVSGAQNNLLRDGDFESSSSSATWNGAIVVSASTGDGLAHSGAKFVKVDNSYQAFQVVPVEPNTVYWFSGWTRKGNTGFDSDLTIYFLEASGKAIADVPVDATLYCRYTPLSHDWEKMDGFFPAWGPVAYTCTANIAFGVCAGPQPTPWLSFRHILNEWKCLPSSSRHIVLPMGRLARLEPQRLALAVNGIKQLKVTAAYTSDVSIDVTNFAGYASTEPTVAAVDTKGIVKGMRQGKAMVVVLFEGLAAVVPVTVKRQ